VDLSDIAEGINPQGRGWINCCVAYYRSETCSLAARIDHHAARWGLHKFKRLGHHRQRAWA